MTEKVSVAYGNAYENLGSESQGDGWYFDAVAVVFA